MHLLLLPLRSPRKRGSRHVSLSLSSNGSHHQDTTGIPCVCHATCLSLTLDQPLLLLHAAVVLNNRTTSTIASSMGLRPGLGR